VCNKHSIFSAPKGTGNIHPPGLLVVCPRREAVLGWPLCLSIVKANLQPMEDQGYAAHEEKPMQQDLRPVGDPRWSSPFLKDCTLWKGFMLEQFVENCSHWEGPTMENFRNRVL